MSTATSAAAQPRDMHAHLKTAIERLTKRGDSSADSLALAEAHFRLAVLPGTDPGEAVSHLHAAIAIDALHPRYRFHLGRVLHKSGDSRGAVCEYRQALRLAPNSHRTWTHLAIALADLGDPQGKLGQDLLASLFRNVSVIEMLPAVDQLIRSWIDPSGKPPGSRKGADSKAPREPCRYEGIGRVFFAEHVSRPKIQRPAVNKCMDSMKATNPSEYAIECLHLLVAGDPPRDIAGMLGDVAKEHPDDAAVKLALSAVDLAIKTDPTAFVESAVAALRNRDLPVEVVVWLHYCAFGPDSILTAVQALRALDAYPAAVLHETAFVELRIAVLDAFARRAWNDGDLDRARLLWRESVPLDPQRIELAHNLALLAARARSQEDYRTAWLRAAEVRYLHAAAAGDALAGLEDRRMMHLAVLQQAESHYLPSPGLKEEESEARLVALTKDQKAVETLLQEWDLYYLNSRLRFRSPVHLLGIARDASPADTAAARDALKDYFGRAMKAAPLAGGKAFVALAATAIDEAFSAASSNAERARDPYYEAEKPEADRFAGEAVRRGLTFIGIVQQVAESKGSKLLAMRILESLCGLPWRELQNVARNMGAIHPETDLSKVLAYGYFNALQLNWRPSGQSDFDDRLNAARRDLRAIYPENWPDEILEAFHTIAGSAAMDALDERLNNIRSLKDVEKIESDLGEILRFAPRAYPVRLQLAGLLLSTKSAKFVEKSIGLLEAGLALKPSAKTDAAMRKMLADAHAALPGCRTASEVNEILEKASNDLNAAVEAFQKQPSTVAIRHAADCAAKAVTAAERAQKIAERAGDPDLIRQAIEAKTSFSSVAEQLKGA